MSVEENNIPCTMQVDDYGLFCVLIIEMGCNIFSRVLQIGEHTPLNSWMVISAGIFVVLAIIYALISQNKRRKLPPGPRRLPVLGYYPFVRKDSVKTISELGERYGSIFGFYMGSQYVVVANEWKTAIEILNKALYRPPTLFQEVPYRLGVSGSSGPEWLETRRMIIKALKEIGFHRTFWEQLVQEEVNYIAEELMKSAGKPVDIREFLSHTFIKNILTLVLGHKISADNNMVRTAGRNLDVMIDHLPSMKLLNFSPRLYKIMQFLGIENKINLAREMHEFVEFVSKIVDEKRNNRNSRTEDSFIDLIENAINDRSKNMKLDKNFKEKAIKGSSISLLSAAGETPRTALTWLLISMVENPEVQKKVHEELDKVLGRDGKISWAQRGNIPYTLATIMEGQRWKVMVPHNVLRMTPEELQIQGYTIPKGTIITVDILRLHTDTKYWKNPERFMPERFLSEDGKEVNMSPDSYMAFSHGKRGCPGKLIAYMTLLQYFTILMQKFKVIPKDGKKLKYDTILGLTYQAVNAEICFAPR